MKIGGICAAAGAALLVGTAAPAQTLPPAKAKTLVYCAEGSPENFNPMINTTNTTFTANAPIYGRLTDFSDGGTEVVPGLAETWEVAADGRAITFHLRHNVKWHSNKYFTPTRDFNADDVLFSFERQWKDKNSYHRISGGGYDYFNDMGLPALLEGIDRIDDSTVRFRLKQPQAPFLANMAMDFAAIQSKQYADILTGLGRPELIDQQPIGTGPFTFVAYQKDSSIRYRAFPDYWGDKPKIGTLVFAIVKDPAVRLAKLRANECQIAPYPNPADLPAIRADPALQLLSQPGLNIGYLAFNTLRPPFTDKRVRQAISMAIDKPSILAAIYQGGGEPAKNLIPPTLWSYNDQVQDWPHDPARAKALLAEAGYPDGFETTLWAMPVQRPYNPDARRMAELIQADLARIGIKASVVSYEWGEYRKRVQNAEHGMALLGWTGDNGDPDNFFVPLAGCDAARIGGGSASKWCNPDFEALVKRAVTLSSEAERIPLYQQAQVIMHEEAPFFFVAHSVVFLPMRKEVSGFHMSPVARLRFERIELN